LNASEPALGNWPIGKAPASQQGPGTTEKRDGAQRAERSNARGLKTKPNREAGRALPLHPTP
jgi:hypothetical protein